MLLNPAWPFPTAFNEVLSRLETDAATLARLLRPEGTGSPSTAQRNRSLDIKSLDALRFEITVQDEASQSTKTPREDETTPVWVGRVNHFMCFRRAKKIKKNGISRELNASPAHILSNYVPRHYYWQPQVVIKFVLALRNVAEWKR